MRKRIEVLSLISARRDKIKKYGVTSLALFGSCAREEGTAASDLDFVVELKEKTFDAYMDLKFYLEELFGVPVDLVPANTIKPRLRKRILDEAIHVPGF